MWSVGPERLYSCQSLDGILATRQKGPCTTLVSAGAHEDARRVGQGKGREAIAAVRRGQN